MTDIGVLQKERDRQQQWADLGLPDPVRVEGEERIVRRMYGPADWESPDRATLNTYFAENPDKRPAFW